MMEKTIKELKDLKIDPDLADEFDEAVSNLVVFLRRHKSLDKIDDMAEYIIPYLPEDLARKFIDALKIPNHSREVYLSSLIFSNEIDRENYLKRIAELKGGKKNDETNNLRIEGI